MLELNARVRDDILGELRIFIQSRLLLFRRRRQHRLLRSARVFCIVFFVSCILRLLEKTNKHKQKNTQQSNNKQPGSNRSYY